MQVRQVGDSRTQCTKINFVFYRSFRLSIPFETIPRMYESVELGMTKLSFYDVARVVEVRQGLCQIRPQDGANPPLQL